MRLPPPPPPGPALVTVNRRILYIDRFCQKKVIIITLNGILSIKCLVILGSMDPDRSNCRTDSKYNCLKYHFFQFMIKPLVPYIWLSKRYNLFNFKDTNENCRYKGWGEMILGPNTRLNFWGTKNFKIIPSVITPPPPFVCQLFLM